MEDEAFLSAFTGGAFDLAGLALPPATGRLGCDSFKGLASLRTLTFQSPFPPVCKMPGTVYIRDGKKVIFH